MDRLHLDIETYSSIELKDAGVYRYVESPDFEILLICYALNDRPIQVLEPKNCKAKQMVDFINLLVNPNIMKHAHNAAFERVCFAAKHYNVPIEQWRCSMVQAAYCGLPLKLETISEVLNLGEKGKLKTGTALINYFSKPCKPTNANGQRTRNLPEHDPEKWQEYIRYCINDVEAEREVYNILKPYEMPDFEWQNYKLDQEINDRGVEIDLPFVESVIKINGIRTKELMQEMKEATQLDNPNSPAQLKEWLFAQTGEKVTTLAKEAIEPLIQKHGAGPVRDVLNLRKRAAKTSIKKYKTMLSCVCKDGRGRGFFQFYGANRTGRFSGRLVQMQNLPRNYLKDLDTCREIVKTGDYELVSMFIDNINDVLSQLVRTAFVAKEGHTFAVADFSAIEARVLAWLAGEEWRLEVFRTHGKIYEASAALMFGVPFESIGKDSPYRQKGKVAELALGYGGSTGALTQMEKTVLAGQTPLTEEEKHDIVERWRHQNPAIVNYWYRLDKAAKRTMQTKKPVNVGRVKFHYDGNYLTLQLPNGRKLFYKDPASTLNRFGSESLKYKGMNQTTKKWEWQEMYGGKWAENLTQAVSRDLLTFAMINLDAAGFPIVLHVHDETGAEVPENQADEKLKEMCNIMTIAPEWAEGLPLNADGFTSKYYKKD
jgi:DNA polymerase